jgi:NAD(P)H dehydrogenase (quinone)
VHGDLLDFDAVSSAMVGVAAAYFCYPIYPPRLLEATAIFAQAATEAGVGAVVNMSQSAARREARYYGPREHWIAERLLDRTPMMTTHLRPTLFADWLTWQWVRHESQGVLRLPFGIARHAPIASADQARVIAAILANPAPHDRQVYPLYGPEELDHHAIAEKISKTLGIPVRYEPVDVESFAAAMRAQGASPFLAQYLSNVGRDYQNSDVFAGTNNLVEVIGGTPPMTVEQYTIATRASFESEGQYAAWASVA